MSDIQNNVTANIGVPVPVPTTHNTFAKMETELHVCARHRGKLHTLRGVGGKIKKRGEHLKHERRL